MSKTRRHEPDKVGRNEALAAALRDRPNGFIDNRPKRQRTRRDDRKTAIRDSMRSY